MAVQAKWIRNLKGKSYPEWPGILDAATKAGLRSIKTTIVQIPCEENGNMAVVMARAEFEDGRVFEDVGDCSPKNVSPQIATAALRMASTRAKGRVLRDAMNIGETMFEELPDTRDVEERPSRVQPGDPEVAPLQCQTCGADVPGEELGTSRYRLKGVYCSKHRMELEANAADAPPACEWNGCGQVVTPAQAKGTKGQFGKVICREHVKEAASAKVGSKPLN